MKRLLPKDVKSMWKAPLKNISNLPTKPTKHQSTLSFLPAKPKEHAVGDPVAIRAALKLQDKTHVYITGGLSTFSRSSVEKALKEQLGIVSGSFNPNVPVDARKGKKMLLVYGDLSSDKYRRKYKAAKKFNIDTMKVGDFESLLSNSELFIE